MAGPGIEVRCLRRAEVPPRRSLRWVKHFRGVDIVGTRTKCRGRSSRHLFLVSLPHSQHHRSEAPMFSTQFCACVVATTWLACGASPPPPHVQTPDRGSAPLEKRSPEAPATEVAKLFLSDKKVLGKAIFRTPLVHVVVSGTSGVFAVDTGAQVSVIDSAFAARAGIEVVAVDIHGQDPAGNPVHMEVAPTPVVQVGNIGQATSSMAVISLPRALRDIGLDGLIAPQTLARSGTDVVVDFSRMEMRTLASSTPPAPGSVPVTDCRYAATETLSGHSLTIGATVAGHEALFEVDSGAGAAAVVATSELGKILLAGKTEAATTLTAAGEMEERIAEGTAVNLAGRSSSADVSIHPGRQHEQCDFVGRMGIPQLKPCVLRMGTERSSILCTGPANEGSR